MKTSLFSQDITHGYLKSKALTKGWALCIGAGTSLPAFPNWETLVSDLIKIDKETEDDEELIKEILKSFTLDALIQSSMHILDLNEEEFARTLSTILYKKIRAKVDESEWRSLAKIFTSTKANKTKDKDWKKFLKVRESLFEETSAYVLAKIVRKSYEKNISPDAILSFNAEPLLFSLINSFEREPFIGKRKKEKEVKEIVDLVTNSISSKCKGRIPYYFCHGVLLNNLSQDDKIDRRLESSSKLVFSESSYLQLANSTFSWQSINFLNTCADSTVIFIGVSLTDSNMRKWLTWIQNERKKDIGKEVNSTQHFWICKIPENKRTIKWIESAVFHLGVRIIWIKNWNETENVMQNLLGL